MSVFEQYLSYLRCLYKPRSTIEPNSTPVNLGEASLLAAASSALTPSRQHPQHPPATPWSQQQHAHLSSRQVQCQPFHTPQTAPPYSPYPPSPYPAPPRASPSGGYGFPLQGDPKAYIDPQAFSPQAYAPQSYLTQGYPRAGAGAGAGAGFSGQLGPQPIAESISGRGVDPRQGGGSGGAGPSAVMRSAPSEVSVSGTARTEVYVSGLTVVRPIRSRGDSGSRKVESGPGAGGRAFGGELTSGAGGRSTATASYGGTGPGGITEHDLGLDRGLPWSENFHIRPDQVREHPHQEGMDLWELDLALNPPVL